MERVARLLLGNPDATRRDGREWRYGTHGSLSIDVENGTWHDHEREEGGGTIELIQWKAGVDKDGALAWLCHRKLIEPPLDRQRIVASYDYTDETGTLLFQVVRLDPKNFRQRRPDGDGGWIWKTAGTRRVPYRLPALLQAIDDGEPIYIAEGEKGVEALRTLGLAATCSPGGAGKWRAEFNALFAAAHVVVLPDNDEPGQLHAAMVAKALRGIATSVHIVDLPGLEEKGDPFDWIHAGGNVADLEQLTAETALLGDEKEKGEASTDADKVEERQKRFQLLSVAQIIAMGVRSYLLKGIMSPGELSVWWGAPKCGKSFLALYIAYMLSMGRMVFGRRVRKCRVLYLACEGRSGLRARVEILQMRLGQSDGFQALAEPLNLFDPGDTETLVQLVKAHTFDLVVVDTLNRVMAGGDENSSADMGKLIGNLDRLRIETGAHVQVIHHGVKGGDSKRGPRGHGSLVGAADAVVEVIAPENGRRTATVTDAKDDTSGRAMSFDLEVVELSPDDDGDARTTCLVVEQRGDTPRAAPPRLTPKEAGWWTDLQDMFATPRLAEMRAPMPGMGSVLTMTRQQVRDGFRAKGRFAATADQGLTRADITKQSTMLNALKDKAKLSMTAELVWLVSRGQ